VRLVHGKELSLAVDRGTLDGRPHKVDDGEFVGGRSGGYSRVMDGAVHCGSRQNGEGDGSLHSNLFLGVGLLVVRIKASVGGVVVWMGVKGRKEGKNKWTGKGKICERRVE